ncbi:hypothetical protein [Candidatus Amarolinea dominans]|uniref:hypothetical protein n=1 Tax=Candidatus Amarolinea dominans TaxID=3140696 RepID=UPI0031CCD344
MALRVAAQLIGWFDVVLDVYRGFLGFDEELAFLADAERVVGRLGGVTDEHLVLMHHLLVLLREALGVVDIPAQCGEEGVNELVADRGLAEGRCAVLVVVALEELDELDNLGRSGHGRLTVIWWLAAACCLRLWHRRARGSIAWGDLQVCQVSACTMGMADSLTPPTV